MKKVHSDVPNVPNVPTPPWSEMADTRTLTELIRQYGDHPHKDGRPNKLHLAVAIWKQALAGEMRAIQMVYDRLEGKVPMGEVVPQPKEPLSDELEHAIDTIYKGSEDGGQSEGTDT